MDTFADGTSTWPSQYTATITTPPTPNAVPNLLPLAHQRHHPNSQISQHTNPSTLSQHLITNKCNLMHNNNISQPHPRLIIPCYQRNTIQTFIHNSDTLYATQLQNKYQWTTPVRQLPPTTYQAPATTLQLLHQHQGALLVCQLLLHLVRHLQLHRNSGRTPTYVCTTRGLTMVHATVVPHAIKALPPPAFLSDQHRKLVRRWQDNAYHATAHIMTSNLGPPSHTPTNQQQHLYASSTSNRVTAANLATTPIPPAHQHSNKSIQTSRHTSRTLLWDLELGQLLRGLWV
ncbi:hypothetical protein Pmani_009214 [Petrolisthes manimaculis]|uniref:Uncharacterized protein n=1 Tax=Petrolisthes manimaculis TaxID=1843537 RepID=A0AAE1Q4Q3_9EUCA|nr:hypothetical protein Pmani_009214 [Petrolisthes manimaculis]